MAGCRNSLFAKVTHKITQVKDEQDEKILEWSHKFNENYSSERKQVLRSFDNGHKTISYLADKVPGPIGFFVNYVLKTAVENSFEKLSKGIKKAAEQDYENSMTL